MHLCGFLRLGFCFYYKIYYLDTLNAEFILMKFLMIIEYISKFENQIIGKIQLKLIFLE